MQIEVAGAERIDDLEPLWASLQEHHAQLDDVPPVRTLYASWSRRRAQYERWLADDATQLFIATDGGRALGYLVLRIGSGAFTWDVGDRVAEVETLAVLPEARSKGVGGALMRAALAAAEAAGVKAMGVGVVHSNAEAIRFYERAGFRQFYLQMLRVSD